MRSRPPQRSEPSLASRSACAALRILAPGFVLGLTAAAGASPGPAAATSDLLPADALEFVELHCASCHDDAGMSGGLDLTALAFRADEPAHFDTWVRVFDRVSSGEMPPKRKPRPPADEIERFLGSIGPRLVEAERTRLAPEGRATRRRMNRYEYENTLRDLLAAPWLQVRESLPEDGTAHRFNKVGEALGVSHVQLARYLGAADHALRQVIARGTERPVPTVTRYHARDQSEFVRRMKFDIMNAAPERATFPVLDRSGQPEVRAGTAAVTVGESDPAARELEGVGVVASTYEPLEPKFNQFTAPEGGLYRLRFNALSVWVGPGKPEPGKEHRWWVPDLNDVSPGRRPEPVTIYAETRPRQLRHLGAFDALPDPAVHEMEVYLRAGETIRPDAARLFRSRPGVRRFQNPLAQPDGTPGVVFRWMEVEGPIHERWPSAGHELLFGDLPVRRGPGAAGGIEIVPVEPLSDARRLLGAFLARAYRRPVAESEPDRFLPIVRHGLESGDSFAEAMIAAYTAVLCSPEFVTIAEEPGRLDDHAVASRLAFFLVNSAPDDALRAAARSGQLSKPGEIARQTDRLLGSPDSRRFVEAFLDYWLDLRQMLATAPDDALYPDYYLDDLLAESAREETIRFFGELIRADLPARNLVESDFAFVNERLAAHYELPPVDGVGLRRVSLPRDSVRGGLLTQASVLKVTANGTTTSPILRGAWILERIIGEPPQPPPPGVPAVEPDIRGATTIREQLDLHRSVQSCASCHAKIDPPGLALESFDVMGGFRRSYRAVNEDSPPEKGLGRGGQRFTFHYSLPVDSSGELADGRAFADVREFRKLLLADERKIARNLVNQLVVYATGAPVRFSDRAEVERILDGASAGGYGVRSLIHGVIRSEIFLTK